MLMNNIFLLWIFISATLSHPFMKGNHATSRSKSHQLNSANSIPLNSASYPLNSKSKLCVNCKHFIGDPNNLIYGKCRLFPIDNKYINDMGYLVTGIKKNVTPEYSYCCILRNDEDLCGISGKMHKRKYIKKARNSTTTVVAGPGKQMNGNTTVQPRFNGTKTQSQSQYYSASSQVNPIQLDYSSLRPVSLLKSIL